MIGWMIPFSLMDVASPSRSTIIRPSLGSAWGSGISELRPLPRAFLFPFMVDDFPCEVEVGLGAFASNVVEHDRLAEAGRLAQPDVPRDDGLKDLLFEVAPNLVHHLSRQVGPF